MWLQGGAKFDCIIVMIVYVLWSKSEQWILWTCELEVWCITLRYPTTAAQRRLVQLSATHSTLQYVDIHTGLRSFYNTTTISKTFWLCTPLVMCDGTLHRGSWAVSGCVGGAHSQEMCQSDAVKLFPRCSTRHEFISMSSARGHRKGKSSKFSLHRVSSWINSSGRVHREERYTCGHVGQKHARCSYFPESKRRKLFLLASHSIFWSTVC